MPTPEPLQGFLLPTHVDPASIPDDLARLTADLIGIAIPRYATAAQRDAAFPTPANGQLAWVTAENAVYVRANGAWIRAWAPPATGVVTAQAGYKLDSYQLTRDASGLVTFWGHFVGDWPANTAVNVGLIPAGFRPSSSWPLVANVYGFRDAYAAVGTSGVLQVYNRGTAVVGQGTPVSGSWLAA